jgi:hypothetical protein
VAYLARDILVIIVFDYLLVCRHIGRELTGPICGYIIKKVQKIYLEKI